MSETLPKAGELRRVTDDSSWFSVSYVFSWSDGDQPVSLESAEYIYADEIYIVISNVHYSRKRSDVIQDFPWLSVVLTSKGPRAIEHETIMKHELLASGKDMASDNANHVRKP